ncbi:SMI1/KNR4 family protein [Halomonas sp. Bachu 37]|uniref:SMI1/KNR4 family protein n=1 Tax=Halomonas kashgarensis TaxID=3084920 RepID=UPI00321784AF
MEKLKELVAHHQAMIRPASKNNIQDLEDSLGFHLSEDYKAFLSAFGVIIYDAYETYGLGVPEDYHLNIKNIYADLKQDPAYPKTAVPLLDLGDGQYYLYDNSSSHILLWATPNGGVVKQLDSSLESFLIKHIFGSPNAA